MTQTTAIATRPESAVASHTGSPSPSAFDRVTDVMGFVGQMGKAFGMSGVAGCKTVAQGEVLAFACLCKRMDPFEFSSRFHLVDGKPQMQAHVILGEMMRAGCSVEWVSDGDDGKVAEAIFTPPNGKPKSIRYAFEDARKAGVVKKDSAWEKSPGAMLRAAVTRKAAKMLMPGVLVGDSDPEEFESWSGNGAGIGAGGFVAVGTGNTGPSQADIERRRQEILAAETAETNVVDAEITPASSVPATAVSPAPAADDTPPFDVNAGATTETVSTVSTEATTATPTQLTLILMDIQQIVETNARITIKQFEDGIRAKKPEFSLEKLTAEQAAQLRDNLRKKYETAKN